MSVINLRVSEWETANFRQISRHGNLIGVQQKFLVADGESYLGQQVDPSHQNSNPQPPDSGLYFMPRWVATKEEWRDLPTHNIQDT